MNSPIHPGSYPQPPFCQKEVCLSIAHYYSVMRQRLSEVYGDRIRFSLTSVPSCVIVSVVEYALSFTAALSARLLLTVCRAPRMVAALKEDADGGISLTFSAAPSGDGASKVAPDAYRELFAGIAARGGFTCTVEGGDAVTVTVGLRRSPSAPTELRAALATAERDPFADALAYPL